MYRWNYRVSEGTNTMPASRSNQISREYYNFLIGEINRGTIKAGVAMSTHISTGTETYYLISY